jgi:hypothetical protein
MVFVVLLDRDTGIRLRDGWKLTPRKMFSLAAYDRRVETFTVVTRRT